jgi:hypothetical protein
LASQVALLTLAATLIALVDTDGSPIVLVPGPLLPAERTIWTP